MQVSTNQVVRKTQFAALKGCTPAYISKLIAEGKLTPPALTADGRILVAEAFRQLGQQADPAHAPAVEPVEPELAGNATYADLKVQNERERLRRQQRENELAEGKLCYVADVERAAQTAATETRSRVMEVPGRVADDIASVAGDVRKIETILTEALRVALTPSSPDVR